MFLLLLLLSCCDDLRPSVSWSVSLKIVRVSWYVYWNNSETVEVAVEVAVVETQLLKEVEMAVKMAVLKEVEVSI